MDEHDRGTRVLHDDPHVPADESSKAPRRTALRPGSRIGGVLESGCSPIHDGPQDVFLRCYVRVQACASQMERPRDLAHARRRVAPFSKEGRRHVVDLHTPGFSQAGVS